MKTIIAASAFFLASVSAASAYTYSTGPGAIWGPGGAVDTKQWVCAPVRGNPAHERCVRETSAPKPKATRQTTRR